MDERNRKIQEEFEYLIYWKKINVNVNSSRNIGARNSSPMVYKKRRTVLRILVRSYLSDAKNYACNSCARDVILSNRYFIGYFR